MGHCIYLSNLNFSNLKFSKMFHGTLYALYNKM